MRVVHGINNLKKQAHPSVVCVGVFDGVHIGHQRVIKELLRRGIALNAKPVVVTFDPHPAKVLKAASAVPMLASLKHRIHILEELGAKLCLIVNFNRSFACKDTVSFIKGMLIDKLNMKMLVVGENFSFGRDGIHSLAGLREIARELGFKLAIVKPMRYHSRVISSSLIRHLIEKGRLGIASKLLSRPVSILGTVVRGKQRGRVIGFRTANVDPHHEAIPPSGVYAAYSKLEDKIYKSVLNIGTRPTFDEKEPSIEVHILGVNRSLYEKDIEIYVKKRLRPERRFKNRDHLRQQILKDTALARKLLSRTDLEHGAPCSRSVL